MLHEIKLVISRDNVVVQTVTQEINEASFSDIIKQFQTKANTILTNLINENEHAGGNAEMVEDVDEESDSDDDVCQSPKKVKNW